MLIPKGLFALDLGTTKFCIGALRESPGRVGANGSSHCLEIIGVPAQGMRRGMVAELQSAKLAINALLDAAEKQLGDDIRRVVVGIAGSHLHSRVVSTSINLVAGSVRDRDIEEISLQVEKTFALEGREILHCVPISYQVDSRPPVENAVGCTGRVLSSEYMVIDADKNYLLDVVKLCNECGLEVARLVSEPFASASVTISDDKKSLGIVLADIGGGTTDGLVFQNGRPCATFTVNVAGTLMTNDLAIGLSLPVEEAERVKVCFGLASHNDGTSLEVVDTRGQRVLVTWRQVYPILAPRIKEMAILLARNLGPFRGRLGAGIHLTGGGSEVLGLPAFLENLLGVPVSKARPALDLAALALQHSELSLESKTLQKSSPTKGSVPTIYASKYATVIGLLNLEIGRQAEFRRMRRPSWPGKYLASFANWLRELA